MLLRILKKDLRNPILAIMLLTLGGWMLHYRFHPISAGSSYLIPFCIGLIGFLIVPFLLNYRKTVIVGYLFNGFSVIIGTVIMAHYSLVDLPQPLTLTNIFFGTTLPDIFILLPKLIIGQMILNQYFPGGLGRMFTTTWWVKHFCYVTVIYSIGHLLLR